MAPPQCRARRRKITANSGPTIWNRVTEIFRLLSNQWKVMETLSPQDFLAFRDKLGTLFGL